MVRAITVLLVVVSACERGPLLPLRDAGFDDVDAGRGVDAGVEVDAGVDAGVVDDVDAGADAGVIEEVDAGPQEPACEDTGAGLGSVVWARQLGGEGASTFAGRIATAVTDTAVLASFTTKGPTTVEPDQVSLEHSDRGTRATTTIQLDRDSGAFEDAVVFSANIVGGLLHRADTGPFLPIDGAFFGALRRNEQDLAATEGPAGEGLFARVTADGLQAGPVWNLDVPVASGSRSGELAGNTGADGSAVVVGLYRGAGRYVPVGDDLAGIDVPNLGLESGQFVARHDSTLALTAWLPLTGTFGVDDGMLQVGLVDGDGALLTGFSADDIAFGATVLPVPRLGAVVALVDTQLELAASRTFAFERGAAALLQPWIRTSAGPCAKFTASTSRPDDDVETIIDGRVIEATTIVGAIEKAAIVCFDEALQARAAVRFERGLYRNNDTQTLDHELSLSRTADGFVAAGGFRGALSIVDERGEEHRLSAPGPDIVNSFVAFFDDDGALLSVRQLFSCDDVSVSMVQTIDDDSYLIAGVFGGTLELSSSQVLQRNAPCQPASRVVPQRCFDGSERWHARNTDGHDGFIARIQR